MTLTSFGESSITNSIKYENMLVGNSAYIPASFESIATATGTGSSGTITFSSIPSTFKSLQIRWIGKTTFTGTASAVALTIQFNGDTATNYSHHYLNGGGSLVSAGGTASTNQISSNTAVLPSSNATFGANLHGVGIIDIIDYTSTSKNKTVKNLLGFNDNGTGTARNINLSSGLWFATPVAITSISLISANSFTTTTQFALYGVK